MKTISYLSVKNATDTSADIYFYGDIVGSEWDKWEDTDTCPTDVLNILDQVKGAKSLNIYVNSGGGSVFAGLAIYNMLKRHGAHKTVHVDGLAASIASIIALAGDEVIIPSNAFMMIHKPWVMSVGNANDLRKAADDLDRIEQGIMNIYAENLREGVDVAEIQTMVNAETWLTGEEASQYFNVKVTEEVQAAAYLGDSVKNYRNTPDQIKQQPQEPTPEPQDNAAHELEHMKMELELLSL